MGPNNRKGRSLAHRHAAAEAEGSGRDCIRLGIVARGSWLGGVVVEHKTVETRPCSNASHQDLVLHKIRLEESGKTLRSLFSPAELVCPQPPACARLIIGVSTIISPSGFGTSFCSIQSFFDIWTMDL